MEVVGALLPSVCLRTIQFLKDEPIGVLAAENCIVYTRVKTYTNSPGHVVCTRGYPILVTEEFHTDVSSYSKTPWIVP